MLSSEHCLRHTTQSSIPFTIKQPIMLSDPLGNQPIKWMLYRCPRGVERVAGRSVRGIWVASIRTACGAKPHRHQLHHYHPSNFDPLIILLPLHTNWCSVQVIGPNPPPQHATSPYIMHISGCSALCQGTKRAAQTVALLRGHRWKKTLEAKRRIWSK